MNDAPVNRTTAIEDQLGDIELDVRPQRSSNPYKLAMRRLWRMPMGKFGLFTLVAFIFIAFAAPLLAPYDPAHQFRGDELVDPNGTYLLGTDQLGRDLLSRVIYASRVSMIAGVLAVSIGAFIGVSTGLIAGYNQAEQKVPGPYAFAMVLMQRLTS